MMTCTIRVINPNLLFFFTHRKKRTKNLIPNFPFVTLHTYELGKKYTFNLEEQYFNTNETQEHLQEN